MPEETTPNAPVATLAEETREDPQASTSEASTRPPKSAKGDATTTTSATAETTETICCRRHEMTDELVFAEGSISAVEIRAFRASIPARRFPMLKSMSDAQVAAILRKDKMARMEKAKPWDTTTQSTPLDDFLRKSESSRTQPGETLSSTKSKQTKASPSRPSVPFSPCNSRAARDTIARLDTERFLTVGTQYDEAIKQYLAMKNFDESKRLAAPFKPNSASQAKHMTAIKYFMNSPTSAPSRS